LTEPFAAGLQRRPAAPDALLPDHFDYPPTTIAPRIAGSQRRVVASSCLLIGRARMRMQSAQHLR
jgi:hypothetical protein